MKNTIQTIISLIRANPKFASMAILLDLTIGVVAGLSIYVAMNTANVEITSVLLYTLGSALILAAVGYVGYTVLYKTGYYFGDEDDYPEVKLEED